MASPSSSGIVTPEAVVLQVDTAGVGSRLVARLLDAVFQSVLAAVLILGALAVAAAVAPIGVAGVFIVFFLLLFGYPIGFESLWRGRTPGKAIMGLRVVCIEGAPIRFRHAAIRALLGLVEVDLFYGAPALIVIAVSRRHQRLGDMLAGTVVVRERAPGATLAPVWFQVPPGYESYVATMDLGRVTPADYAAARSFLLRAPQLAPEHRTQLAWQLARPLAGRLGTPPPSWVGPEAFLWCLAAAYQDRSRHRGLWTSAPTGAAWGGTAPVGGAWGGTAPAWAGPAGAVPVPVGIRAEPPPSDTGETPSGGFAPPP